MDFAHAPTDAADLSSVSPEAAVSDREQLTRLDQAIRKLPAGLRDPLVLTALEGMSHTEAGTILGVSAKSVEMSVYRARRRLAEEMNLHTD
jgi:RNA polymerase sigma-70 factor (ECF subfamily)